ncbi:MAG TPA: LytTR family DNA-binding domain-containing protein [Polyangiaceae bacterium]|nr:LytTR family DNA-binding domain-containing protein [Polyangiaceae bacterium]
MTHRVLIVEDERPARTNLARMVSQDERFRVVGEATDGIHGLEQIEALRPDLVLLDIEMPRCNGFEMLAALEGAREFAVIFATAHDSRALEAFEAHALDYLLKPYDPERIARALHKAHQLLLGSRLAQQGIGHLVREPPHAPARRRLVLRTVAGWSSLPLDTIRRFSAQGKHVEISREGEKLVARSSLRRLEQQLEGGAFVRVHRGEIVRVSAVRHVESCAHGDGIITLDDGSAVPLSRSRRQALLSVLNQAMGET